MIISLGCPLELLESFKKIPVLGSTMESDDVAWGGAWAEGSFYAIVLCSSGMEDNGFADRLQFHHRPKGEAEMGR